VDTARLGTIEGVFGMNRYHNPVIFEHLAMSYALGTLQGKARQRFEALQARHLYLRAVTEGYQQQFAPLVALLPSETPPPRVWQRISKELRLEQLAAGQSAGWWAKWYAWLPWSMTAVASMAAAAFTVLLLNRDPQPDAYMAALMSTAHQDKMLVATVKRATMDISFAMPQGALPVLAETHLMPTVWCISKHKGDQPMRMGTLAAGGAQRLPIDKQTWQAMAHIETFAISLEPMDQAPSAVPRGEVVFSGKLAAL
jgi:anti-sigma-K factor RskA